MLKRIIFVFALIIASVFCNDLLAGSGMGMGMGNPCGTGNFPPCPSPVPIDGGILLLAGAGIAMGARKMMKKN